MAVVYKNMTHIVIYGIFYSDSGALTDFTYRYV